MNVISYTICSCDAVTINFEDGQTNSAKPEHLKEIGIWWEDSEKFPDSYQCNHCVNGYGLDLCGCGSKETIEDCDLNLPECGQPREILGESVKWVGWRN